MKIGIINGTVRDDRVSPKICEWILEEANKISDFSYEVVDLRDYKMGFNMFSKEDLEAKKFNEKLQSLDGYIFLVAEYNHSISGVLKNALDWVMNDSMANKAGAIISYGAIGGARAAEHLRGIIGHLKVADVSRQVMFNIFTDFDAEKNFRPQELHMPGFVDLIGQLELWSKGLKTIR